MPRYLFIFVLMLSLLGCRQKNESLHNLSDSLANAASDTTFQGKLTHRNANAVVVGEGVRLRSAPDTRSDVVEKLNTGALLKIIRTNEKSVLMGGGDTCNPDGYFWYEVLEPGGKKGWIYGAFIYHLLNKGKNDQMLFDGERRFLGRAFTYRDKQYEVGFAYSGKRMLQGANQDQLCGEFLMPYFFLQEEGIVWPLKFFVNRKNMIPMPNLTREQGYMQFGHGGAGEDKIEAFRIGQEDILVTIGRDVGDDEPFWYTLILKAADGYFSAIPADPGKEYFPEN